MNLSPITLAVVAEWRKTKMAGTNWGANAKVFFQGASAAANQSGWRTLEVECNSIVDRLDGEGLDFLLALAKPMPSATCETLRDTRTSFDVTKTMQQLFKALANNGTLKCPASEIAGNGMVHIYPAAHDSLAYVILERSGFDQGCRFEWRWVTTTPASEPTLERAEQALADWIDETDPK